MYPFVNGLLEDGLQRPNHVAGASQNNKQLFMVTCAVIWIKCCVVSLLHRIWITLNCMGKFPNIDGCGRCPLTCSDILYSC